MRHTRNFVAMLGCCVAALAVLVGNASAKPIFNESFHDEGGSITANFCGVPGLTVSENFLVDGRVRATSHGPDGFPYFLEHVKETSVVTNLHNGKFVTFVRTGGSSKDLKVTDNLDGTLTVLTRMLGNDVIYGPDGKAIARNPGQVRIAFLIDHGGTPTDPFDDHVIDFEVVKPSTGRSDDLCAAMVAAIA